MIHDAVPFTPEEPVMNQMPPMPSASRCECSAGSLLEMVRWCSASKGALFLLVAIYLTCTTSLHAQWTQVWGGDFPGASNTTYNHADWWNNVEDNTGNVWGD